MKKVLSIVAALSLGTAVATAETFTYNFGTGTGTYTTNNSASTTFLPAPPTGGGTARVRVSNGQGGGYALVNPGDTTIGTATELVITAPTGGSANKFSIYDYTAGKTGSLSFTIKFNNASSGTWVLAVGDGATYSDNATFANAQMFAGIQWVCGASSLTGTAREGTNWVGKSALNFDHDTVYRVDIIMNNTTSSVNYAHSSDAGPHALAANTWDLWVDGTRTAGISKAALADDSNIDSILLYGVSSTSNAAQVIIDDIRYSNDLVGTLPVELDLFQID